MNFRLTTPMVFAMGTLSSLAAASTFTPRRLSHSQLTAHSTDSLLIETLSTDGIVSITGIPGFQENKRNLMTYLHSCLTDMENDSNAFQNQYKDGTVRRTMASVTIPGPGGARPFDYDKDSANCQEFSKGLDSFRKMVDSTTDEFADRLSMEMGSSLKVPLMSTKDGEYGFDEFKDVVR